MSDSKSNDENEDKIILSYRGNKNTIPKGKFAERGDVLYKKFIRATRRYLWVMFEKEFDVSKYRVRRNSIEYKRDVGEFYNKYFREHISNEANKSIHEDVWFILGVFLSNQYSLPK